MKKIVLLFIILISFQLFADNPIFATKNLINENYSENSKLFHSRTTKKTDNSMELAEANDKLHSATTMKNAGAALIGVGGGFLIFGGMFLGLTGEEGDDGLAVMGISLLCIAPFALVTGLILTPLGAIREKEAKVKLENLSVAPTKGGVFTTVGFRF